MARTNPPEAVPPLNLPKPLPKAQPLSNNRDISRAPGTPPLASLNASAVVREVEHKTSTGTPTRGAIDSETRVSSPVEGSKRRSRHEDALPIRIMFLQGLDLFPENKHVKMLQEVFGKDNVVAPKLHTKRTLTLYVLLQGALVILMLLAVGLTFASSSIAAGISCLVALTLVTVVIFFLAGRGATHLMLRQATAQAEQCFKAIRPNTIVAKSFGAVAALQMDAPKVPLLLLSPAIDQYYRYMNIRPLASIGDFPYVVIVHGSTDQTVTLDDSIRLVETCEIGRCRLEVVDDNHRLQSLGTEDLKNWVEEAFERGREVVLNSASKGGKAFDPTLFVADQQKHLTGVAVS